MGLDMYAYCTEAPILDTSTASSGRLIRARLAQSRIVCQWNGCSEACGLTVARPHTPESVAECELAEEVADRPLITRGADELSALDGLIGRGIGSVPDGEAHALVIGAVDQHECLHTLRLSAIKSNTASGCGQAEERSET